MYGLSEFIEALDNDFKFTTSIGNSKISKQKQVLYECKNKMNVFSFCRNLQPNGETVEYILCNFWLYVPAKAAVGFEPR